VLTRRSGLLSALGRLLHTLPPLSDDFDRALGLAERVVTLSFKSDLGQPVGTDPAATLNSLVPHLHERLPNAPARSDPSRNPEDARVIDADQPPDLHAQPTFGLRLPSPGSDAVWRSETEVEARDILLGMRVLHRSHGAGTVLSVKPSGKGAELLVRFDIGGEKWIAFGYGVLEFARDAASE